jgi:hypothetical protein
MELVEPHLRELVLVAQQVDKLEQQELQILAVVAAAEHLAILLEVAVMAVLVL